MPVRNMDYRLRDIKLERGGLLERQLGLTLFFAEPMIDYLDGLFSEALYCLELTPTTFPELPHTIAEYGLTLDERTPNFVSYVRSSGSSAKRAIKALELKYNPDQNSLMISTYLVALSKTFNLSRTLEIFEEESRVKDLEK